MTETPQESPGRKDYQGKTRWWLFPFDAAELITRVLMHGAEDKYCDEGWKKVEGAEGLYWDACIRHLKAYRMGELIDEESGLPALAHAGCDILFLIWHVHCKERAQK